MEEPWDELMGPSPEDLKNMLRDEERRSPSRPSPPRSDPPVLRGTHSSAPPPSAVFSQFTSSRTGSSVREGLQISASAVPPASRSPQPPRVKRSSLAFEDEHGPSDEANDPERIREEAMKVLGVAENRDYAVQRTASGNVMSSSGGLGNSGNGKRVRSALSGLSYSANRVGSLRSNYRDEPYIETEEPAVEMTREDYEYGDEGVVDVVGMERRSMASRPSNETSRSSKNWSSRYSVDNTLLAMSGGAASQRRFLDNMDRNNDRQTSRNLFGGKSTPSVFGGSGYSFRKKHVFGKQQVTVKPPTNNLQTVWMDMESSSLPPANNRSKSWQEQLQQKRIQRRRYILAVLVAFCFTVTLASVFGVKNHKKSSSSSSQGAVSSEIASNSVTFYVTADTPYNLEAEERLRADFKSFSPQASMLFHVGNLQDASTTLCQPSRYADVADLLKQAPVPTFVLPGEEDVSNCPDPVAALELWEKHFEFFHRNFLPHNLDVMEQDHQYQNLAVVHEGVLFLGMHITAGTVDDEDSLKARNQYNYKWTYGNCKQFQDEVRAVVLMGNARPGEPVNRHFFEQLGSFLGEYEKPVVYIHANPGNTGSTQVYQPYKGIKHVMAVQVGNGGDTPPVRVDVGFGARPFIIG